MTDYSVPTGWKKQRTFNEGNSVTFTLPNHTVAAPSIAVFDRKLPVRSPTGFSKPYYRVRISHMVMVDGEYSQILVDTQIRWPYGAEDVDVSAVLAHLADVLGNAAFRSDVVEELRIPYDATPDN